MPILVTAPAAQLPHQAIARQELARRRIAVAAARFQVGHGRVTLQAAGLDEAARQHGKIPVRIAGPTVLLPPAGLLFQVVGRVRGPAKIGGTPLPFMAGRAAELCQRMRTVLSDEQVRPRMAAIGLLHVGQRPLDALMTCRATIDAAPGGGLSGHGQVGQVDSRRSAAARPRGRRRRAGFAGGRSAEIVSRAAAHRPTSPRSSPSAARRRPGRRPRAGVSCCKKWARRRTCK